MGDGTQLSFESLISSRVQDGHPSQAMGLAENNANQPVWESVQAVMRGQISAPSFETWIAPLQLHDVSAKSVTLQAASAFNRDWVLRNYRTQLAQAFAGVMDLDNVPTVNVTVNAQGQAALPASEPEVPAPAQRAWSPRNGAHQLNPRYTFEQFVVGNHNRFCHAAALAVAETPAQNYNPLFIYGEAGLGKTHLMQAIGHFVVQHHSHLKVKYVTTEQFTNELIQALAAREMKQFRDRYRQIDVLILDDVQFLEGKERTQEEVFHTFNALHQAGKQIILSSDRAPNRLTRLEERLRSRFGGGLIADITPPDFETRVAILDQKAQSLKLTLATEVLHYVANCVHTNVRELEGALNRLSAYKMLTGCEITLEQAETLLGKRFDPDKLSKEDMIDVVARYYHLTRADITSSLRTKHIAHARQVAVYVIRELTEASFPQIGHILGGRKHNTVLYAYEKVKEHMAEDPTLRRQISEMMDQIKHHA